MKITKSGFTIVELLVVIVVIAILASVTTVGYTNIQSRGLNSAKAVETKQWNDLFLRYVAQEGQLPSVPEGFYCLGYGFPDGDGAPGGECRDYENPPVAYHETDNTILMDELRKATDELPSGPRQPISGTVGPYIYIWSNGYRIESVFQGNSADDCPSNMLYSWTDGSSRLLCGLELQL